MPVAISRRSILYGLLAATCPCLSCHPGWASIAQGIVKPLDDMALTAAFDDLCVGAMQILAGERPAIELTTMLADARSIHAGLLPLPDIGGPENLVYASFVVAPQYVALYRAMRPHGFTAAEVGRLIYDLAISSLAKESDELRRNGERFFTPGYFAMLQDWAARSQERRYPMDWVQTVFRGDGTDFDIGVDYVECGLVKYFAAQGVPELAPYPCRIDFPTAQAEGTGLERTTTLATGGHRCDFRYKKGRPVTQVWNTP
jgi:hypothetical protein